MSKTPGILLTGGLHSVERQPDRRVNVLPGGRKEEKEEKKTIGGGEEDMDTEGLQGRRKP